MFSFISDAAFIEQTISRTVNDAVQNFLKKLELKDSETSIKEEILLSGKVVADQIISSTHDKIDNINAIIEDKFRIPDNVLIETDRKHYKNYTKLEEQELREEVAAMEKHIIQVIIILYIVLHNIATNLFEYLAFEGSLPRVPLTQGLPSQ